MAAGGPCRLTKSSNRTKQLTAKFCVVCEGREAVRVRMPWPLDPTFSGHPSGFVREEGGLSDSGLMRAVRLVKPGSPLEMQEVELPRPGAADVLVRVKAAGICHSDAHYRAGRSRVHPIPLTLGHEVAGVIEQPGSEVLGFQKGDRVCVHYMATCGD